MNFEPFIVDTDYLLDVHNNTKYNEVIVDYFKKYSEEVEQHRKDTFGNIIKSIDCCNKFFEIDKYSFNMIKDFKRTNLCKNKFCNNCKKVKQASRMSRYIPEIEQYKDKIYHVTFTVPNCKGKDLKKTLKKMIASFSKLTRFINGTVKSSVYNFKLLGYLGCIRSLEITFTGDNYHPHFHCCFAFDNLDLNKIHENCYSYDKFRKKDKKLFSDFEIVIQKMWYMLINDIRLTKENFDLTEVGYSCNCDKFKEGDYAELFKYMTKETDEKNNVLTYDNFKILYESTYALKQIQGYGCFYKINDENLDEEVEKEYVKMQLFLQSFETPINVLERPIDLMQDNKYTLISRKKIFQYMREEKPSIIESNYKKMIAEYGDIVEEQVE